MGSDEVIRMIKDYREEEIYYILNLYVVESESERESDTNWATKRMKWEE